MYARFTYLNLMLVGVLIALQVLGILPTLIAMDKYYAMPIIGVLTIYALWAVATRRKDEALWLADKLPVVGLALTVIGLLGASTGDLTGGAFKADVIHALVGNLMGVLGFAWVELNVKVFR